MDEQTFDKPLLCNQEDGSAKDQSLLVPWTRWILKMSMCAVFISWLVLIFLYPSEFGNKLFKEWTAATKSTPFGITGSMFLAFSGPILVIAVLAVAHVALPKEEILSKKKRSSSPRFRLWTFPVLVDGPFGVVSAAEFLGILFFAVFLLWAAYAFTMRNLNIIAELEVSTKDYCILLLQYTGVRFGMIGLLCMTLLFLPIARGSVLLRLIDIPFEHATRYHVWLGHVTMISFTIHGLSLVIGWWIQGRLAQELLEWKAVGISRVPGAISLLCGLLMWVTSLGPVRNHYFELFFYTHQLYMVFIVFLALHVGDFIFSIAGGGIFLYMLDRFLRFCQSRKPVDVLSAKVLPSGTVELVLSKPANLQYNALSFIFLQVRELSWLQWHPFSVSSSPLDGKYHITVLIKVLGGWTAKLKRDILRISEAEQEQHQLYPKITASVEGPYGHKSHYYLMYENLILVAGGIGISPFFAILRDLFNRIRDRKYCLARKVLVVWAIKNSDELDLLSTIDIESIYPSISNKLKLDLHIYVTRQSEPPLEEGMAQKDLISTVYPESNGSAMSVLVDAGENIWTGLYVISSIIGLIISLALLYIFYINKFHITVWWYKGLLFVSCMVASVLVFGGLVVGLWHLWEQKASPKVTFKHEKTPMDVQEHNAGSAGSEVKDSVRTCLEQSATMVYGRRPDFREIFRSGNGKWDGVDVGVIACGPKTLQSSVAREIRSHNLQRAAHHPIFHFNCHSFDL